MIELRTILVPTDFSANAAHAYPYAAEFARRFSARLLVAHVTEPTIYAVGVGQVALGWEQIESDIRAGVDEQFAKLRADFPGQIEPETVRLEGTPFAALIQLARSRRVDLIVMATHGHTGVKHLLLGSTAERVVRKAPCPVLTVHPGERSFVMP
ncbi:MAG: universal stress protein [Planctomycetes bacterium]|nr:universal stress protein [Planctomycetota bacterium]